MPDLYVIAATGSRSLQAEPASTKEAAARRVRSFIRDAQAAHGPVCVMSGMAEGFDKVVALTAIRMRVPLWCAVPNRGYGAYYWGRKSLTGRNRLPEFNLILDQAWRVTYVMEDVHRTRGLYLAGRHSNFVRNDFMVERGAEFMVWDSGSAGTRDCLASIVMAGKRYTRLDIETPEADHAA